MTSQHHESDISFDAKDITLALSSMPYFMGSRASYLSVSAMPERRLEDDDGERVQGEDKEDGDTVGAVVEISRHHESDVPFDVLEMVMELCDDISYVNFRATCRHLTTPMRKDDASITSRLRRYSPWLMVLDQDHGIISFTDPVFGDKYRRRAPPELNGDVRIHCCMYGWLLISAGTKSMMFYNPFTSDIRKLPDLVESKVGDVNNFWFSAPPSSPDCFVMGFAGNFADVHYLAREHSSWSRYYIYYYDGDDPDHVWFPTFHDQNLYALDECANLYEYTLYEEDDPLVNIIGRPPSRPAARMQFFLVKCDEDLLLVMVDKNGGSVEVCKRNETLEIDDWETIDGLGKHMIYICDTTCVCMEAPTREMENKIYFPMLHPNHDGKIVLYSLDTCRYHTFSGSNIVPISRDFNIVQTLRDIFGPVPHRRSPHAWILPTYPS